MVTLRSDSISSVSVLCEAINSILASIALRSRQGEYFLFAKIEEATRSIEELHIDRKCKKKMSKTRTKNAIIWSRNSVAAEAVTAKHMTNKSL